MNKNSKTNFFSRKLRRSLFFLNMVCAPLSCCAEQQIFVTYDFSGGRFGDNLLAYLHAKWISYQYEIPLLYIPFPLSSELILDNFESPYDPVAYEHLHKIDIEGKFNKELLLDHAPTLFTCPYFPECEWERASFKGPHGEPWPYFQTDWESPEFRKILKALVAPKQPYPLTIPPQETINIAIHFREGGGYDITDTAFPFITKFPPIEFYINGLLKAVELFKGKSLYCYVFSDALNPPEMVSQLADSVPFETQITFDCRSENNRHDQNVLSDFFSLFHFDVLIHPQSNFSSIPSLIHDYAMTYTPLSGYRNESIVTIDKVKCKINQTLYKKLMQ